MAAKGWRWFFILCVIPVGINSIFILLFSAKTNYRRILYDDTTAEEADKQAVQMFEYKNTGKDGNDAQASLAIDLNPEYTGSYWKDLVSFKDRAVETRRIL